MARASRSKLTNVVKSVKNFMHAKHIAYKNKGWQISQPLHGNSSSNYYPYQAKASTHHLHGVGNLKQAALLLHFACLFSCL